MALLFKEQTPKRHSILYKATIFEVKSGEKVEIEGYYPELEPLQEYVNYTVHATVMQWVKKNGLNGQFSDMFLDAYRTSSDRPPEPEVIYFSFKDVDYRLEWDDRYYED
jgi:hypothetical protein